MIRTATVTDVTDAGVWVQSMWLPAKTGPLPCVGQARVGDLVLVVRTDDGEAVIVGPVAVSGSYLSVSAPAEQYAGIHIKTGGVNRWFVGKNTGAESGGDVGSSFIVWAYDDTGTQTHKPIAVFRDTGRIVAGLSGAAAGIDLSLNGPRILHGSGDPNGTYTAPIGSTFHRTDGGAGTSFYVKESGAGSSGWVAK